MLRRTCFSCGREKPFIVIQPRRLKSINHWVILLSVFSCLRVIVISDQNSCYFSVRFLLILYFADFLKSTNLSTQIIFCFLISFVRRSRISFIRSLFFHYIIGLKSVFSALVVFMHSVPNKKYTKQLAIFSVFETYFEQSISIPNFVAITSLIDRTCSFY